MDNNHAIYSLVVPVYKNEDSLPDLLNALEIMNNHLDQQLQVVFVVDGSPDQSYQILRERLPSQTFASKLLLLSRNFGSYPAFRTGLEAANGQYFSIMSADLQEPPELIMDIFTSLKNEPVDIVFSMRKERKDPFFSKIFSKTFWFFYKKLIQKDIPQGGVDVFGCNRQFRDELMKLNELNSSFVGLACWLGFRRKMISYNRLERQHGKSAWNLRKKIKYAMDSSFAFSDLPIRLLYLIGFLGICLSTLAGSFVVWAKMSGMITVPGYATTIIIIVFFAALNLMGLGIIGSYIWRAFENTKVRPHSIVMSTQEFNLG